MPRGAGSATKPALLRGPHCTVTPKPHAAPGRARAGQEGDPLRPADAAASPRRLDRVPTSIPWSRPALLSHTCSAKVRVSSLPVTQGLSPKLLKRGRMQAKLASCRQRPLLPSRSWLDPSATLSVHCLSVLSAHTYTCVDTQAYMDTLNTQVCLHAYSGARVHSARTHAHAHTYIRTMHAYMHASHTRAHTRLRSSGAPAGAPRG